MIYIASPYSHDEPEVREERYWQVGEYAAKLINLNEVVYSPIVHCHQLAVKFGLPTTFDFWQRYDFHVLDRCDEVHVVMLDGWEESKGVALEIQFARNRKIPITFVAP